MDQENAEMLAVIAGVFIGAVLLGLAVAGITRSAAAGKECGVMEYAVSPLMPN